MKFILKFAIAIAILITSLPGVLAGILYTITVRGMHNGTKIIDKADDWYDPDND